MPETVQENAERSLCGTVSAGGRDALPKLDGGSQRLDLRQVSFEGDISEYDGTLSFYMPVTFDPDAVFGTNVTSDSNGDWLNVYANYDLETGGPEQSLTVVLVCGDGNEFEFSYPLTASDSGTAPGEDGGLLPIAGRDVPG